MQYRVIVEEPCKLRTEYLVEADSPAEAGEQAISFGGRGIVEDFEYVTFGSPVVVLVKGVEPQQEPSQ